MSQQPGQPGQQPQQYPQQGSGSPKGRTLTILAFVFGGVSILFLPIIFGPVAIVLAIIAINQGDPLAKWALGVAVAGMVVGFALGYAYFNAVNNFIAPVGFGLFTRRQTT